MLHALLLVASAHAQTGTELLQRMNSAWQALSSYTTGQRIQERVGGTLGPEQQVRVAFRKPWEIQLEWETVHPGRKVYWCACRNDGEVRVYPGGLTGRTLGILGFSLDSRILKQDTNYTPAAAGFGYLVDTVWKAVSGPASGRPQVGTPVTRDVSGQRGWAVPLDQVHHPRYARAEIVLAEATGLPLQFSAWSADGQVAERYAWFDTALDVPLGPANFDVGYAE